MQVASGLVKFCYVFTYACHSQFFCQVLVVQSCKVLRCNGRTVVSNVVLILSGQVWDNFVRRGSITMFKTGLFALFLAILWLAFLCNAFQNWIVHYVMQTVN